jgi:type I restriction enzyme S subunit
VAGFKVAVADKPVFRAFDAVVQLLAKRIDTNAAQSQKLAALRDLLLPKLLSGEIRVPVA